VKEQEFVKGDEHALSVRSVMGGVNKVDRTVREFPEKSLIIWT
jgi:hypothetical protein